MKKISTLFLQAVVLLIALITVTLMIWFPLTEGRAKDLDLLSIYADPLIIYIYLSSIAFFIALYKAFKLLGYIGQNRVFSAEAVNALKVIKYCAISISIAIVIAGIYIRIAHNKEDDPAGFLALCIITTFVAIVVATASALFQKLLQTALNMKSENDLTI
jgi:hypothetical protein